MMMRFFQITSVILLGLAATFTQAQTAQEQPVRHITFRTLQLAGAEPEPVFLSEEGAWKRSNLSKRRISPEVKAKAVNNKLFFARPSEITDENGKPMMQPVAEVQLPETGGHFLILFREQAGNPGKLQAFALNQDDLQGQAGQTILYNASSYPIVGEIEKQRFNLEQGARTKIEAVAGQNNNLSLRLARYAEDEWKIAFSTIWGHKPNLNTLFFITDAPTGKDAIDVQRFYDMPVKAEPEAQRNTPAQLSASAKRF